jgi:soluble lytic murein transglycosylase-like protein
MTSDLPRARASTSPRHAFAPGRLAVATAALVLALAAPAHPQAAGPSFRDVSDAFQAADYARVLSLTGAACEARACPTDERAFFAGLAAWRLEDWNSALAWFEASEPPRTGRGGAPADLQTFARGAFWAARAQLRAGLAAGDSMAGQAYLDRLAEVANVAPLTLYGKLAEVILGLPPVAPALPPTMAEADMQAFVRRHPQLGEALGHARAGRLHALNTALLAAARDLPRADQPTLQAFAQTLGSAHVVYWVASRTGDPLAAGRFPTTIPDPADGWRVDRAVVLAIMHQESRFNPHATSEAGARGLVQLMPATAAWVSGDQRLRREPTRLFEPGLNLQLGQRYIEMMFEESPVKGDLILCLASYNAGPGTVGRWWRRLPPTNDPLLALESLPNAQVREYVRKVLANLWVYRAVLNQPDPSPRAVAENGAPIYREFDGTAPPIAEGDGEPAIVARAEPTEGHATIAGDHGDAYGEAASPAGVTYAALTSGEQAVSPARAWWQLGHAGTPGDVVSEAFRGIIFERLFAEVEASGLGLTPES